jgi:hypothetical protein
MRQVIEILRLKHEHLLSIREIARSWLHPAAKVRANRVRALLRQRPLLTTAQKQTWNPPSEPTLQPLPPVASPAPCTPRCQLAMKRLGSWHAGQAPLQPRRPP